VFSARCARKSHDQYATSPTTAVAFSADSALLYASGGGGNVTIWDVKSRKCMRTHVDEGSINSCSLITSADGRYYATGSDSGVVNVYDASDRRAIRALPPVENANFKIAPRAALMGLTTPATCMAFNSQSHILAMGSKLKRDCFKIVHLPSMTTFSNWPTTQTPLRYVNAVAFSPHGGYLTIGNDKGKVLLYRLNHYLTS
jgi:U3 small nucleolar RNA-associated protein 18